MALELNGRLQRLRKVWQRLTKPASREAFVKAQIDVGIPFQIRALMKQRGLTQAELAARLGIGQPRVSAMLKAGQTRPNINTLLKLSAAFDCGLMVKFLPFSELARWSEDFHPDQFNVAPFSNDSIPEVVSKGPSSATRLMGENSASVVFVATGTAPTFAYGHESQVDGQRSIAGLSSVGYRNQQTNSMAESYGVR